MLCTRASPSQATRTSTKCVVFFSMRLVTQTFLTAWPLPQLQWCGSSTWLTPTGRRGIQPKQRRLNRTPKEVSRVSGSVVTRSALSSLFSLTDNTWQQPWRLQILPVPHRTMAVSPPPGSISSSTSWDNFSPLRKADGKSSRCPPLALLLKMMTRRVSVDS